MTSSSWYRRTVFNFRGSREFTKAGYDAAKVNFNPADLDVSCTDRHYMITGSNSGIGYEVALHVAKLGGIVHMVCRNEESARQAQQEIFQATGNENIFVYKLDLSRPRDVAKFAQEFCRGHNHLHVLVNNAGCMIHERKLDDDGIEYNFAVNTLAVHILTTTLVPLLQASPDSRVVTVTSGGMFTVKLDPEDLMFARMDPFNGVLAYSQNKRQQVVMTLCYAQMFEKVHFSCMHPGWADTPAVRTAIPAFYQKMKDSLRTAKEGADTAVWLAISYAAVKHTSGLFFQDRVPVSPHFPLAWTRSSPAEEEAFMRRLNDIVNTVVGVDASLQPADSNREDIPSGHIASISVAPQDADQKNDLASEGKVVEGEENASVVPETTVSVTAKEMIDVVEETEQNTSLETRATAAVTTEEGVTDEVTKQDARAELEASTAVTVVERVVEITEENASLEPEASAAIMTKEIADVDATEHNATVELGTTTTVTVKERVDTVEFSKQYTSVLPEVTTTITTKEMVNVEAAEQNTGLELQANAIVTAEESVGVVETSEQDPSLEPGANTAVTTEETIDVIEVAEQNDSLEPKATTAVHTEELIDVAEVTEESNSLEQKASTTVAAEEMVDVAEVTDENDRLEAGAVTTVDTEKKLFSEAQEQSTSLEPEATTMVTTEERVKVTEQNASIESAATSTVITEELIDVGEVTEHIASSEPRAAVTFAAEEMIDDFGVSEQNASLEPGTITVVTAEEKADAQVTEQNASFESLGIKTATPEATASAKEGIDIEVTEQNVSLEQKTTTTVTTEEWTNVVEVTGKSANPEPKATTVVERKELVEITEQKSSKEPSEENEE